MYKRLIYNYRWLISNPIKNSQTYLDAWKHFVALEGLLQTIDYIEPTNIKKRDYLREYVNKNRTNYLKCISPNNRRIKSNYWKGKVFNAYKEGKLEEFYVLNKDKFRK